MAVYRQTAMFEEEVKELQQEQERREAIMSRSYSDGLPPIKVVGVGGGGCNAVNRMVKGGVPGVEFIAMNTDRQALESNLAPIKVPLGENQTRGVSANGRQMRYLWQGPAVRAQR